MRKVIYLGLLGLIIGYVIFGRSGGEFISILDIINPPQNLMEEMTQTLTGLQQIRRNILISGGVGAVVGLVFSVTKD